MCGVSHLSRPDPASALGRQPDTDLLIANCSRSDARARMLINKV
jgi:hypothetical protein